MCRSAYCGEQQAFGLSQTKKIKTNWEEMPPVLQPEVTQAEEVGHDKAAKPVPTWSYRRGTNPPLDESNKGKLVKHWANFL